MHALVTQVALGPRSLPPLIGGFIALALALFLALRRGQPRVQLWFVAIAMCSAFWSWADAVQLGAETAGIGAWTARVSYATICACGPCALCFGAALARVRTRWRWPARLVALAGVAICLGVPSLTAVVARPAGGYWPRPGPTLVIAAVSSMPPLLYAIWLVRRAAQALPPCRHRRQLAWAWAGLVLGALGAFDIHTVYTRAYPTGWAWSGVASVTLFYAIAQHRLVATRTFVRQALIGGIGLLAGAVVVATMVVAGPRLYSGDSLVEGALLVAALFVLVRLWTSLVEPALTYVFGWRRRQIERAFFEFERRALAARSTDDVAHEVAVALADAFDARVVRVLPADRERADEHPSIAAAELALAQTEAAFLRDLVDLDDARAPRLLDALNRLDGDALLPLIRDRQLLAVLVITGHDLVPADDLVADELTRLGRSAALAWVNARLYHEVSRRSAGLEQQVRLRTRELEEALGELRDAHARLVEVERSSSLGLLVAGVSHEINNALNIIHANLPTLARYAQRCEPLVAGSPDAAVQESRVLLPRAIAGLGDAVRRTRAIVEDLRRFARPDTERRLVRVQEGLDAALNLLRRRTDGRLNVARVYIGTPSIDGYPGQLNQCFFNLLLNAVEAARSEIWIMLSQREDAGVELIITDDGDGIPAVDYERVFQAFFTTKPRAAGLGLTVSRSIVQRHGGTLDIVSSPGQGATVRLTLPASAPETDVRKLA